MKESLYTFAYAFLLSKKGVTKELLQKHFEPQFNRPDDMRSIYFRLCESAQNKQMSSNVIGKSIGGIENLSSVLFDFNPHKVADNYRRNDSDLLMNVITKNIKRRHEFQRGNKSLWPKYCQSVIDSAYFLSKFPNSSSFLSWADDFIRDEKSKPALPLLISIEIRGIGFALACDFLKEIGYSGFGKPDTQIKQIFSELNLIDSKEKSELQKDYQTFKMIDQIARENDVTSFMVDKVFWLIGSGNFYLTGFQIRDSKDDFITKAKKHFRI